MGPRGREAAKPLPAASPPPATWAGSLAERVWQLRGERDRAALLSFLSFFLQIDSHDSRVARRATRSESQHKVAIPGRRGLGGSRRLPGPAWEEGCSALRV